MGNTIVRPGPSIKRPKTQGRDLVTLPCVPFEPIPIGPLRLAHCIPNLHSNSDPEGERKVRVHERERDPGESSGVESCILGDRSPKAGWRIYSGVVLY